MPSAARFLGLLLLQLVAVLAGAQGRASRDLLQDAAQTIIQGQISAGYFHTCSIKSDGSAWCWGDNFYGQLGDDSTSSKQTPAEVSGGGSWLQISAGYTHTCGLKSDSTAWCWGGNRYGQLGDGGRKDSAIPLQVAGGGTWLQISTGGHHTCGIKIDGSAWCWGYNFKGQLGSQPFTDQKNSTIVSGGGTWLEIDAGYMHTCGIKADSTVWCWGDYNMGKMSEPTAINSSAKWIQISAGHYITCGIQSNSTAWCWGEGRSTTLSVKFTTPTELPGNNSSWLQVSVGDELMCGITTDLSAWCWGNNAYGQVGDGTFGNERSTPVKVYGGYSWQEVSAGSGFACGITQQGDAMCWGSNVFDNPVLGSEGGNTYVTRAVAGEGPWGLPEGTSASPPSPTEDISTTSTTNIGAIVGGVVGGFAVLAAIAAFILWRKRRPSTATPTSIEASTIEKAPTRPEDSAALAQSLSSLPILSAATDPVLQWVVSNTDGAAAVALQCSPTVIPSNMANLDFTWPEARVVKPLGAGSFGKVYLGTLNHTPVALKLLIDARAAAAAITQSAAHTDNRSDAAPAVASYDALIAEASILASLRHPNVALLVGYCLDPPCLALEYASRGSLLDVLRKAAADPALAAELTWHRRLSMAADAAAGMLHLHTRSPPILHRDLKSPNLLVTAEWTVKVTDMGLSKIASEAYHNASATNGGGNNPRWLAPEVLNGARATAASDVFSFGVVMWELLTWKQPWERFPFWSIAGSVHQGTRPEVPALNELPGELVDAVTVEAYVGLMQRCWAQVPGERPTFEVVASDLRAFATSL